MNYSFDYTFENRPSSIVMTSVRGHITDHIFRAPYDKFAEGDPIDLFDAPIHVVSSYVSGVFCWSALLTQGQPDIDRNLQNLARGCDMLFIWTDCDREGEDIGWEILDVCRKVKPGMRVCRAHFSEMQAAYVSLQGKLDC